MPGLEIKETEHGPCSLCGPSLLAQGCGEGLSKMTLVLSVESLGLYTRRFKPLPCPVGVGASSCGCHGALYGREHGLFLPNLLKF